MSERRRVMIRIQQSLSDSGRLDVILPEILPRSRMQTILVEELLAGGWERRGDQIVKKEDKGEWIYEEATAQATVSHEKKIKLVKEIKTGNPKSVEKRIVQDEKSSLAAEVSRSLDKLQQQFRETITPGVLEKAIREKVKQLDGNARFERTENGEKLILKIELETGS